MTTLRELATAAIDARRKQWPSSDIALRNLHNACTPERMLAMLDVIDAARAMRARVPVGTDNVGIELSSEARIARAFDAALARLDAMEGRG